LRFLGFFKKPKNLGFFGAIFQPCLIHQRYRRTSYNRKTAFCTRVHRAVKSL